MLRGWLRVKFLNWFVPLSPSCSRRILRILASRRRSDCVCAGMSSISFKKLCMRSLSIIEIIHRNLTDSRLPSHGLAASFQLHFAPSPDLQLATTRKPFDDILSDIGIHDLIYVRLETLTTRLYADNPSLGVQGDQIDEAEQVFAESAARVLRVWYPALADVDVSAQALHFTQCSLGWC